MNGRPRRRLPHPVPYQGSKRLLAPQILAILGEQRFHRLYEPFAGSAALTLAAAHQGLASTYLISDSLCPLVAIWCAILGNPTDLSDRYRQIWNGQEEWGEDYYDTIREQYNRDGDPAKLLYLLARCVKNAPRFNRQGQFNQSPDRRRLGMHPTKMRAELLGAAQLLAGRAQARCADFEDALADARPGDLVYLDPPYQGTSQGTDKRYHQGLARSRLITVLQDLNRRGVPYILSYDGRSGAKEYGSPLPTSIQAVRYEIHAGRSSQATLLGKADVTVESLYVSRSLGGARQPGSTTGQLALFD